MADVIRLYTNAVPTDAALQLRRKLDELDARDFQKLTNGISGKSTAK